MKHLLYTSLATFLISSFTDISAQSIQDSSKRQTESSIKPLLTNEIITVNGTTPFIEKDKQQLDKSADYGSSINEYNVAYKSADLTSGSAQSSMQAPLSTAGPTPGQLDVSATGGATYTVPLSIPPGLGNMVPQLSLSYNSHGSNGIVGLGWNIGGLSAISRIPATPYHDNKLTAVNFNADDRFALDGQRLLLKSGTYGADGAEYQTENYSNVKIVSRGTSTYGANYGPAYFEVFYPDGSKAVYGENTGSRTRTSYAITYLENPLGARINYTYSVSDNTLIITEIAYGNMGTSQTLNRIQFQYSEINRAEMGYTGGERLYRKSLLGKITITGNGSRYRSYNLYYENVPSLNYKRVVQIMEYDANEENYRSPLYFTYGSTGDLITTTNINSLSVTGIAANNSEVITADYTGNGSMDFLLVPKNNKTKFWAFYDMEANSPYMQLGYEINTGPFKDIFPGTILSWNEKILPGQGIFMTKYNGANGFTFNVYAAASYLPVIFQYDKGWNDVPKGWGYYSECDNQFHEGPTLEHEFVSGDFNGDGLTDIIALNRPYYGMIIFERRQEIDPWNPPYGNPWDTPIREPIGFGNCIQEYGDMDYSQAYFIDMDRRATNNYISSIGYLGRSYKYGDKLYTGDLNGDGKTDIIHITNGNMYVYSLNNDNNYLELLWQTTDGRINTGQQALIGDYNGDGKTDVMFTTGYNNLFAMFLSTGKGFDKHEENHPFSYTASSWNGTPGVETMKEYQLIATDINGDGKTDIISTYSETRNSYWGSGQPGGVVYTYVYHNMGTSPAYKQHFAYGGTSPGITVRTHYPMPIFLNPNRLNPKLEFGFMSNDAIRLFRFSKDFKSEAQLTAINQDGITHSISYRNLESQGNYTEFPYEYGYSQTYPYVDLQSIPGLNVVEKITRTYNGQSIQQVFGYSNAVTNMKGLGFLGFGKIFRSNWHTNSYDENRILDLRISDPQLRGAITKTFKVKYGYINPNILSNTITSDGATINDYLSRTDYSYNTLFLANKVFVNVPLSIGSKDLLNTTSSQQTNEYDNYYNIAKTTHTFGSDGSRIEEMTYDNNPQGYYIGRPLSKKTTLITAADNFNTEEEYTYTGHLPTQVRKKGNGTPWINENLTYDNFGNIVQKSITTNSGTRSTSAIYEATGRFPISLTDSEGLTSTTTYNLSTGNVLNKTNAFGQGTTFVYDNWGRILQTSDYLGKKNYTSYLTNNEGYIVVESNDEGNEKTTYSNHSGQVVQVVEKTILGTFIGSSTQYDAYGRAYRQSQPSSVGNYNQWDQTEFDQYGRVKKTTTYTGKTMEYTYNGLSTAVNDGSKTVTTTKNNLGQTISLQDPGGTINYTYYAHGGLKAAEYGGSTQSLEYDGWGRKTKLIDPSAGQYSYTYNGFGEITKEATPKGETNYNYDNTTGKLLVKTLTGDGTDIGYSYTYNATSKLLESLAFTNTDGNNSTYSYTYDSHNRLEGSVEDNLHARFAKSYTYDTFGRLASETYEAKVKATGTTAGRTIDYTYQNGGLLQATDRTTGQIIRKASSLKPNGQMATELRGNNLRTTYNYDTYNLPQSTITERTGTNPSILMALNYSFDAIRGNLNNRSNSALSWNESFTYDQLDRLTTFNDNNGNNSQSYDDRGRITNNSQLGNYGYDGVSYKQTDMTSPTPAATTWYQDHSLQQISYNSYKKPININEQNKEQIDFSYNAALQRSHMYYGSADTDKELRPMRRHYSEDGSMEITRNIVTGETSFIFYLGSDAYDAPAIYKEVHNGSGITQNLYYLHRDHLGSIVLITDVDGNAVEKRQFDAWGNIVALTDGNGNPLSAFVILDRGFTGHEHLLTVGLINMNGRLYDPKLHRFLSPDNYVQDPSNTQNFNRYGYAMNNPLIYTDQSGEFLWAFIGIGALIGALTGGVSYVASAIRTGNWSWKGLGMSMLTGAVIGGITGAVNPAAVIGGVGNNLASAFAGGLIPSANLKIGNFAFSISPSLAFGQSFGVGVNLGVSYTDGHWNFSAGFGIMHFGNYQGFGKSGDEIRSSLMAAYDDGTTRFSLSNSWFSGSDDMKEFKQRSTRATYGHNDFSIGYENDGSPFSYVPKKILSNNTDVYRTNAVFIGVKEYSLNLNMFTGRSGNDSDCKDCIDYSSGRSKKGKPLGIWSNPEADKYRLGILALNYKGYNVGVNSEHVRDVFQNWFAHKFVSPQPGFRMLSKNWDPYVQFRTNNGFSQW